MSTTVTYKGSTLATVENQTKVLTTSGKYLEDNITLVDVTSGGEPSLQAKTYTVDSAGTTTVTADSGYDGLSSVSVSVPNYSFGVHSDSIEVDSEDWLLTRTYPNQTSGYLSEIDGFYVNLDVENKTVNPSASSQIVTPTDETCYLNSVTVAAMPTGTAGTPTATKGTVSNHQVSVTPSVTNTSGYITGSTINGTAVTVSASELVSGSQTVTSNQTVDVTNLAELVVNVPSKNTQVVQSTTRTNASTLTAIGSELTVSKTGTYDIYYSCFRTNTSSSYTWATRLYINGTAYGTAENATWTNNQQNTHLSNISLTVGDKLRVYGRNTRGTSYYVCAPTLAIVEA